jgi:hypothetical protein
VFCVNYLGVVTGGVKSEPHWPERQMLLILLHY